MVKKVNIYYAGFSHRIGGVNFHTFNLAQGLKEFDYKVNIITLDSLPIFFRYIPHIVQNIGNIVNFPFGFIYKQHVIKYLFKTLFKNSAEIDIFEDIYTYWKSDAKSIVVLHALWSDNLQAFNVTTRQRVNLESKEVEIINAIEANIITVSKEYKSFIVSRLESLGLKKNIHVVELGININKFTISQNNNMSIIYVGALEERKNIKFLLKVFLYLKKRDNYKLTIIGEGPQKEELISMVNKNTIKDVTFMGSLQYSEIARELRKHQYYMHTSTKESFSYALLEAKLSGLTTIASSKLEVPGEFIDIKVNKFSVNLWVNAIQNFENKNNRFVKDKFSYQLMTKNTLKYINDIKVKTNEEC